MVIVDAPPAPPAALHRTPLHKTSLLRARDSNVYWRSLYFEWVLFVYGGVTLSICQCTVGWEELHVKMLHLIFWLLYHDWWRLRFCTFIVIFMFWALRNTGLLSFTIQRGYISRYSETVLPNQWSQSYFIEQKPLVQSKNFNKFLLLTTNVSETTFYSNTFTTCNIVT